ncbi:FeoA family protein [Snodgrassella alvi]|uniref:FeoA family protein n=1 Tax=Snodgrassella alvi TaxID=1196083 RepID=UPI000C1F1308|nr:FeoA family protein [Snodgrassella alvi]
MPILTLDQLPFGQPAVITHLLPESIPFRRRLLAMGITPGSHITVIRTAPMGDPLEVKIRGFYLCLRRSEAQAIGVVEAKQ